MVEQGWLRDVTRPLLIFCFIISDASWAHDGCSTFSFPSGSTQNKEESKRGEGWPRWIKRAKLLQKSLVELHLAYYLELITWPRVAAREAGDSDFLTEHMATLYASSAVRVKESVEWVASRGEGWVASPWVLFSCSHDLARMVFFTQKPARIPSSTPDARALWHWQALLLPSGHVGCHHFFFLSGIISFSLPDVP